MIETFEATLASVKKKVAAVLELDATDADAEAASSYQNAAAEQALRWIVENSVDLCSQHLAAEVLKAIDSDGKRW